MDDLASEHPSFREVRQAKVSDIRGDENKYTLASTVARTTPFLRSLEMVSLISPMKKIRKSFMFITLVWLSGLLECKPISDTQRFFFLADTDFESRLGAKKVVIFDHIVRNQPYYPQEKYSMGIRDPVMCPHIDVTHKVTHPTWTRSNNPLTPLLQYAPEMFRDVQGRLGAADIDEVLSSGKRESYNLWRPIKTVKRDALAVLDTRSATRD